MKKSVWYVVLLILILAVAVVLCVKSLDLGGKEEQPEETPGVTVPAVPVTPEETEPPHETPTQPTETPEPTEEPVFVTKEPVSPTETPEPTPEVTQRPPVSASGSFSSNTGTYLNLLVEWSAYTAADGSDKLQVDVSATSYAFNTSALYNAITITVGGQSYTMNSPEVSYEGSELATTPLASITVDAPQGDTEIRVVWDYRGSYSGKELDTIEAVGTAGIR